MATVAGPRERAFRVGAMGQVDKGRLDGPYPLREDDQLLTGRGPQSVDPSPGCEQISCEQMMAYSQPKTSRRRGSRATELTNSGSCCGVHLPASAGRPRWKLGGGRGRSPGRI